MMFRLPLSVLIFSFGLFCYSQKQTNGKAYAEIFGDFHYNISDTTQTTGFSINRAHLGYEYLPEGNISATMIVDIGTPEDLAPGSKSRRYGYFREASVTWADNNLELTFGITGTRIFAFQQKFWGQRYLDAPVISIYGFGYVADLGLTADYKFSNLISADLTIMNGEGYTSVQLDDNLKTSLGITLTPSSKFTLRFYADIQKRNDVLQNTLVGFLGYKSQRFTSGAELSYKTDIDGTEGHNGFSFSTTTLLQIAKKTELFLRYDHRQSVVPVASNERWNAMKDGSYIITGIQYRLSDNVRIALNYRAERTYNDMMGDSDLIFFNSTFKF